MVNAIQVHPMAVGATRTLYVDCTPHLNGTTETITGVGTPSVSPGSGLTVDTETVGGSAQTINGTSVPASQWFSVKAVAATAGEYEITVQVTTNSTNTDSFPVVLTVCVE